MTQVYNQKSKFETLYSPNPTVNAKIHKLLKLGVPPIPVAPKLDPKHPDGHRVESPEYRYRSDKPEFVSCNGERVQVSGDYCKFITTAVGSEMASVRGEFVRLDSTLSPTPLFTGKNPSFLGWDGKHRKLNHGQFQNRMPTDQEIKKWFANPNTGIGTLGGHNGIVWIDFDAKNYHTQEDCDRDVQALLDRIGKPTLTEKTGSGGYRVAVVPTVKPTFTNFSSEPGGKHLGEALFAGRYTVLAPSKHPNGNYYKEICDADPVEIESLEAIGLYPSKDEAQSQQRAEKKVRKGSGDRSVTQQIFSDPVDNPWDIRNFAQFFEGYSERDGWGYAKCPAHNGTSLTSFRVRLDTGEFKAWCGCDTKSVYEAAKNVAAVFCYKFPEKRDRTPHPEHGHVISREDWEEKHKSPQEIQDFSAWIKKQFNRSAWKFWRRTGNLPSAPKPNPQNIVATPENTAIVPYDRRNDGKLIWDYIPDKLPTREEWIELGRPTIKFKGGERIRVYAEAKQKGWGVIKDSSATGQGKSHDAGKIKSIDLGIPSPKKDANPEEIPRIFYLADDHRNPTTATVEQNFTDLPTRHDGLISDPLRVTALGFPHIRRPLNNETTNIPANCPETKTFRLLETLGRFAPGGKGSAICENCPLFTGCQFLSERHETLIQERIRAHIDQMPSPREGDIGIIDEPGKSIVATRTYSMKADKLLDFSSKLRLANPDLDALTWPLTSALHDLLMTAGQKGSPKYGYGHEDTINLLPSAHNLVWHHYQDDWIETDDAWKIPSVFEVRQEVKAALKGNPHILLEGQETPEEKQQIIKDNLALDWLYDVLGALDGARSISLSIARGELRVTAKNYRHQNIIKAFDFTVFLDATLSKFDLAKQTGINPDDILEIKQEPPNNSNLTIKVVKGLGRCGRQREHYNSNGEVVNTPYSVQNRAAAVVEAITARYPEAKKGVIDFKPKLGLYDGEDFEKSGYWFHDNRGSNRFLDIEVLVGIGTPTANLGQLAANWQALTGEIVKPEAITGRYGAWVRRHTDGEIVQLIGRPRAHLRPHQQIVVYLLADLDPDFIRQLPERFKGATVEVIEAYDLTPAGGSKGTQTERGIIEAMLSFAKTGAKATINGVADTVGVSKGRVSQVLKKLGGFKTIKKSLVLLLEGLNSKTKLLDLSSDAQWLAHNYLPLIVKEFEAGAIPAVEVLSEFVSMVKAFGWKAFEYILAETPAWVVAKLLGAVLSLLPDGVRLELSEMVASG